MTWLFRYILMADNDMTPCAEYGVMTLAACEPRIRSSAKRASGLPVSRRSHVS